MLDTDTKRRIDTARDILVGKVPDPKSQVEQITIALIYKFMDDMDAEAEELGGKRKVEIEREADGRWLAEVMELPGVLAYGGTEDEAIARVQALALRVVADRLEHDDDVRDYLSISFKLDDLMAQHADASRTGPRSVRRSIS